MDKLTFCWILQCALLYFDKTSKEEMVKWGADSKEAEAGIRLCEYLKSIKTSPKELMNK